MLALPKSPIPGSIKLKLTSSLLLPSRARANIDRGSAKYDSSLKVLSFTGLVDGKNLVIAEQPTPEQFVDIPAAYEKVLGSMNDYSDFDTTMGTVHLTKPDELHGGQTAVLNAKGTLLFAKSASGLSTDQWRQFFNSVTVDE
jgi:hypothetical protein